MVSMILTFVHRHFWTFKMIKIDYKLYRENKANNINCMKHVSILLLFEHIIVMR